MKTIFLIPYITLLLHFTKIVVASTISCNSTLACPEDSPCCSSSGVCGSGSYCLGGCDPRYSFNNTACLPQPICKSGTYNLTTGSVLSTNDYLGNSTEYSFVYDGTVLDYNDNLLLALPQYETGTVLSSTFFVWYGQVSVRFKSSHGAGVVSACILFSNVQDEIDLEFIGNALEQPQTNYYFQGVLNLTNEVNLTTTDTYENWHTYEINWTEDYLEWGCDGDIGRTLYKNNTLNETTGIYMYPQTPSRIQISIWPGGDDDNSEGTIAWAGGAIDWNATEFTDPGYLYAILDSVEVECYDVPDGIDVEDDANAYVYTDDQDDWTQDYVKLVKKSTMIKDLSYSGLDTGLNSDGESEDSDDDDNDDDSTDTGSSSETTTASGDATGKTTKKLSSTSTDVTDFVQDTGSNSSSSNAAPGKNGFAAGSLTGFVVLLASYLCMF